MNRLKKISLYGIGGIICLLLLLFLLLQIPAVQTYLGQRATSYLSETTSTRMSIDRLGITFFNRIEVEGLYIEDQQQDTLVHAGKLKAGIDLLGLMRNEVDIHHIDLQSATVKLQRRKGDTSLNYQFLIDAFASEEQAEPDTSSSMAISVGDINLNNIHFLYNDVTGGQSIDVTLAKGVLKPIATDIAKNRYHVAGLTLNGADIRYDAYQPDSSLLATMAPGPPQDDTSAMKMDVMAHMITIDNSSFHYNDHTQPQLERGMDYNHMNFGDLAAQLKEASYRGGTTISGSISELAVQEQNSGLALNQLSATVDMDDNSVAVQDAVLSTPRSTIRNNSSVQFSSWSDFASAMDKVTLNTRFRDSKVALADVAQFVPSIYQTELFKKSPAYSIKLNGSVTGTLNDLAIEELSVNGQKGTSLALNGSVMGLQNTDSMQIDAELKELRTTSGNLQTLLADFPLPQEIQRIDSFNLSGTYNGSLTKFASAFQLETSAGQLNGDLKMELPDDTSNGSYQGKIQAEKFESGRLLGIADLGKLSFDLTANGSGFTFSTADVQLDGVIHEFNYMNYAYDSIAIDGVLAEQVFRGALNSGDQHANVNYKGTFDLSDTMPNGDFHVAVNQIDFHKLNLSEDKISLSTNVRADFAGTSLQDLTGNILLEETAVERNDTTYRLDTLALHSSQTGNKKEITLQSDFFHASLKGRYEIAGIGSSLMNFYNSFLNSAAYHDTLRGRHNLRFQAQVTDRDVRFLRLVDRNLRHLGKLEVKGSYNSQSNQLDLNGNLPKVIYNDIRMNNIHLDAHILNEQLHFDVGVKQAKLSEQLVVPAVNVHGTLSNDSLSVSTTIIEPGDSAVYRLALDGEMLPQPGQLRAHLHESLILNNKQWQVSPGNTILIADTGNVVDVSLQSGNAKISVNTLQHNQRPKPIQVNTQNLRLNLFSSLVNLKEYEFDGLLNGNVVMHSTDEGSYVTSDLTIDNFSVNRDTFGTITARIRNDKREKARLAIEAGMEGPNGSLAVNGSYNYIDQVTDLQVSLNEFNVATLSPYLQGKASKLDGAITGSATITGKATNPTIDGSLNLNQVEATVDYLGTHYVLEDETINFNKQQVLLPDFQIKGKNENTAVLTGTIDHNGFSNIDFNLDITLDRFPYANASPQANEYFYGKGRASGKASIRGSAEHPRVNLQLQTEPVTDLKFPISYQTEVVQEDFYRFINQADKDSVKITNDYKLKKGGLSIDARINVKKDARFTLIMDPEGEDNINVRGNGNVNFNMAPDGSYKAVGSYNIIDGSYLFTFKDLVKKKFDVREESVLQFAGDPMDARFDLTAIYSTKTTTYPLMSNHGGDFSNSEMKSVAQQKVKVNVLLHMKGTLEDPEITFEITVPEIEKGGAMGNTIVSRLRQINNNETMLNKQVFALILFDRFISDQYALAGEGGNSPTSEIYERANQTVSQFFSRQLNKVTGKYLEGFEMDVALQSRAKAGEDIDYLQDTDVKVQASQKLFNDRLTVKVGSDIGMSNQQQQSEDQITGDFIVEYRLNKKGNIKVKAFRVSDQDLFEDDSNYKNGFSLKFEKNFDKMGNLLKKKKPKQDTSKVQEE